MDQVKTGWQELNAKPRPRCPKLFYKFQAGDNGYELQFTDLVGLWTSQSDSTTIRDYAKTTRASIDPSEDSSQLRVLLKKLAESLENGDNILRHDESSGDETILLQTALELTKPLQPLKWEFSLISRGAAEMAEVILRPCLHEASESKRKADTLIATIDQKDRIISKLLDKIEASSMDLSLIFPGITGARARKGQTTIADAQRKVPGLKAFSKDEWLEFFASDSPYAGFETSGLSKLVGGCEKCPKHTTKQHTEWLSKLPRATATVSQVTRINEMRSSSPNRHASDANSDNELETQKKKATRADSDTESDDNPDTNAQTKHTINDTSRKRTTDGRDRPQTSSSPISKTLSSPRLVKKNDKRRSTSSTATDSSSGGESSPKGPAKLGGLGSKIRTTSRTLSSSPPPSRPSTKSKLDSSPPPVPPSRAQSSSSEDLPPSNHKPAKDKTPERTSNSRGSNTPSRGGLRRLGKLGQSSSQASSRPVSRDMNVDIDLPDISPPRKRPATADANADSDTDTSTASEASDTSPKPTKARLGHLKRSSSPTTAEIMETSQSQSQQQKPVIEPEPDPDDGLTKEEKVKRRREELKRKIGTSDQHGTTAPSNTAGTAAPALRKKRKF